MPPICRRGYMEKCENLIHASTTHQSVLKMSGSAPVMLQVSDDCDIYRLNSSAFQILSVLIPSNSSAWHRRTYSWFAAFYVLMVIYCVIFLSIALACVFLLIKRHLVQRFRVRTFIVIDLALITLGVSRILFILLDPWDQLGFCNHLACIIISRLLESLAFPSLTASYTLVFITLWLSARIDLGRSWIQRLKVLIPLCFVHYGVAIFFEIIAVLPFKQPLVIILILIACEVIFCILGFLVCLLFMIAGFRLLRTLKKTAKRSSVICKDTPSMNRLDLINKFESYKNGSTTQSRCQVRQMKVIRGQQRRTIRKVTLITFITVFLGMIYSILRISNVVMITLSIFEGCLGMIGNTRQHPGLWLAIRCIVFTLESSMAVLLTYAISDYTPLINLLKKCCQYNMKGITSSPAVEDAVRQKNPSTENVAVDSLFKKSTRPFNDSDCNGYSPNILAGE